MVDSAGLDTILNRLEAGKRLSKQDLQTLVAAVRLQQVTIATGDRAVAIGGSADGAVIVTGDRNILIPKELAQLLQERIGNAGNFNQQIGDRPITLNYMPILFGEPMGKQSHLEIEQLCLLLKQLNNLDLIQAIERDTLPQDAQPSSPQTVGDDPIHQLVTNLHNYRKLPDFVQQLAHDENVPPLIQEKLAQTVDLTTARKPITKAATVLQSHLLMTVRRHQASDQFVVNGWLIPDDAGQDRTKQLHPLDLDPLQKGTICHLSQIPKVLDQFVDLSLDYLKSKRYELTIEIFLPLDYLHEAVDHWEITDLDDQVPVGTRYRVLVRTSDRLTRKYLNARLSDWYGNWERVQATWNSIPNADNFEHLKDYCNCDWDELEEHLTQKIGLKLTCGLLEEHRQVLFKAVHRSATSIAIWMRHDNPELNQASAIDALILSSPLSGLLESIKQRRKKARWKVAQLKDELDIELGKHLAILWENPYRLPPEAEQLTPPGQ